MKNILVTIDAESEGRKLLLEAEKYAKAFNSKIWILHIIEPTPEFVDYQINEHFIVGPQYIRNLDEDKKAEEHKMLEKLANELIKKGIESEGITIVGPTIDMILEEVDVLKIDLIVIGSHKHGIIYNALIGDTTSKIIKKSNVPILVIPLV